MVVTGDKGHGKIQPSECLSTDRVNFIKQKYTEGDNTGVKILMCDVTRSFLAEGEAGAV